MSRLLRTSARLLLVLSIAGQLRDDVVQVALSGEFAEDGLLIVE